MDLISRGSAANHDPLTGKWVISKGGFTKLHRPLQFHWWDGQNSYFRHLSRMTQFRK